MQDPWCRRLGRCMLANSTERQAGGALLLRLLLRRRNRGRRTAGRWGAAATAAAATAADAVAASPGSAAQGDGEGEGGPSPLDVGHGSQPGTSGRTSGTSRDKWVGALGRLMWVMAARARWVEEEAGGGALPCQSGD